MEALKQSIATLKGRFVALEKREKLLISAGVLAGIFMLGDFLLLQPNDQKMDALLATQETLERTIKSSEAELTILQTLAKRDPSIELGKNLHELKEKLTELDKKLEELTVGLVPAQKLPDVLHDVLRLAGDLKVVKLTTLPPEKILISQQPETLNIAAPDTDEKSKTGGQENSLNLFKHSVEVELEGGFVKATQYLSLLEQGNWGFYWDSFRYQVTTYPQAKMSLKVFTLSSQVGIFDGEQ
jgi:MSHA biogenesis protein MshJ